MGLLGSTEGSFFLPFPLDPQFWGTIQAADHHFRVCSEHPPSGRGFLLSKMAQPLGGWGGAFQFTLPAPSLFLLLYFLRPKAGLEIWSSGFSFQVCGPENGVYPDEPLFSFLGELLVSHLSVLGGRAFLWLAASPKPVLLRPPAPSYG